MIASIIFTIGVRIKFNEFSQAPFFLLATFGIILYLYILDNFTQSGYFVISEGIYFNKKLTPWDQVSLKKDSFVWKILLQDRNLNIHFDRFHQKSILILVKRHCPKEHELYKSLEEFAKDRNLPF